MHARAQAPPVARRGEAAALLFLATCMRITILAATRFLFCFYIKLISWLQGGLASLGFELPAAIGAALANRHLPGHTELSKPPITPCFTPYCVLQALARVLQV